MNSHQLARLIVRNVIPSVHTVWEQFIEYWMDTAIFGPSLIFLNVSGGHPTVDVRTLCWCVLSRSPCVSLGKPFFCGVGGGLEERASEEFVFVRTVYTGVYVLCHRCVPPLHVLVLLLIVVFVGNCFFLALKVCCPRLS